MSTLRSWTNREELMNLSVPAGRVAAGLRGTGHEEQITQHLSWGKVHLGPINELGWGWQTESCFPELSPGHWGVHTFFSCRCSSVVRTQQQQKLSKLGVFTQLHPRHLSFVNVCNCSSLRVWRNLHDCRCVKRPTDWQFLICSNV